MSHICKQVSSMSNQERWQCLRQAGACYKCLRIGHRSFECVPKFPLCESCPKVHHKLLCDNNVKQVKRNMSFASPIETSNLVFMQTLIARSANNDGNKIRILLDSGSERSFILKSTSRLFMKNGSKC